jgi:hypothetical protein
MKVWHWAHRGQRNCDRWWESETEWHRSWKGNFPKDWQEIIHHADDGEKHIADVKTSQGLVIEFQHSFMKPKERSIHSSFYGNMVWVVDGTRRLRDLPRFVEEFPTWRCWAKYVFTSSTPEYALPKDWLDCSKPVYFDFGNAGTSSNRRLADTLWCLLPDRVEGNAVIIEISRAMFIESQGEAISLLDTEKMIERLRETIQEEVRLLRLRYQAVPKKPKRQKRYSRSSRRF